MSEKIIVEKFSVDEKLPEYDHECIVWFKDGGIYVGEYKYATLDYFLTEQKAIDFCKRFNLKLKVVNEEQSK